MAESTDQDQIVQEAALLFEELCVNRYQVGEEEYGHNTWLENDTLRMMLEELADVVNYASMHAIKLIMLQRGMEAEFQKAPNISVGAGAFRGTTFGWKPAYRPTQEGT